MILDYRCTAVDSGKIATTIDNRQSYGNSIKQL